MPPILHIGPTKTASTSLQEVIPRLGIPYVIKPHWVKSICRHPSPEISRYEGFPEKCIVSCELLGSFDTFSPAIISQRFYDAFGRCVIVYVHRDIEERMLSMDRFMRSEHSSEKWNFAEFKALHRRLFEKRGAGYYAATNLDDVKRAFENHDFRVLDFELLKSDPQAFLKAFCDACEVPMPDIQMPHLLRAPRT